MPNLVSGHMRFTEEDFLLSDYREKIKEEVAGQKPKEELCTTLITQLRNFLNNVKDGNTSSSSEQKAFLSESLFKLTSLAHILGFTLEDLIKEKI
jgi:hypothetical protein